jgi:hypothetical protein
MLHQLYLSAKLNTVARLDAQTNKKAESVLKLVQPNITILYFVLANEEPRGAWKTLLDSEFGGGNTLVSRLRRDPISASNSDFVLWRYLLYKIRTYFESNPDAE